MAVRVVMADDAFLALEALRELLDAAPEIDLVAVCRDADELREAVEAQEPDVVLTDIRMPPGMSDEGIRFAVELRRTHPATGVVILSAYCEPAYALALLESGTEGRAYLLKERVHSARQLVSTIQAVARGGAVVDPKVIATLLGHPREPSSLSVLSAREYEILVQMAAGESNDAIARAIGLTKRAVEKHISAIFAKLDVPATPDVSRRVRAVLLYLTEGEGEGARPRSSQPRQGTSALP